MFILQKKLLSNASTYQTINRMLELNDTGKWTPVKH